MENRGRLEKALLLAVKIAVGSSAAIYIAGLMNLQYASSAGIITLLSLLATKWETVKLSLLRLISFFFTTALAWLFFPRITSKWLAFGIIILIVVFLSDMLGLRATLSVNAVAATHFMTDTAITIEAMNNELMLVLIGIAFALVLNMFHFNHNRKKDITDGICKVEENLQAVMRDLAFYLLNRDTERNVWEEIVALEKKLKGYRKEATEYQENTFQTHTRYYSDYFEMRLNQCHMLDNLHSEIQKMRGMPRQAEIVANYMYYLSDYVTERNIPDVQRDRLNQIFEEMTQQDLPETREEFESRALLYHVLMDIEEFLNYKAEFIGNLDEVQKKEYWK